MSHTSYANRGAAALVGAAPPCCAGCGDKDASRKEATAMVAGAADELRAIRWFVDNRWLIMGTTFAVGGVFFGTVSYFVNRD